MSLQTKTTQASKTEISNQNQAQLPSDFEAVSRRCRQYVNGACEGDAIARYKIGAEVQKVTAKDKKKRQWGVGAVERLALAISISVPVLYRYRNVAKVWNSAEFEEALKTHNAKGLSLTWTHFELLSQKKVTPEERKTLLGAALAESLSSTELQERIGKKVKTENTASAGKQINTEVSRLKDQATESKKAIEEIFYGPDSHILPNEKDTWQATAERLEEAAKAALYSANLIRMALAKPPPPVNADLRMVTPGEVNESHEEQGYEPEDEEMEEAA